MNIEAINEHENKEGCPFESDILKREMSNEVDNRFSCSGVICGEVLKSLHRYSIERDDE